MTNIMQLRRLNVDLAKDDVGFALVAVKCNSPIKTFANRPHFARGRCGRLHIQGATILALAGNANYTSCGGHQNQQVNPPAAGNTSGLMCWNPNTADGHQETWG